MKAYTLAVGQKLLMERCSTILSITDNIESEKFFIGAFDPIIDSLQSTTPFIFFSKEPSKTLGMGANRWWSWVKSNMAQNIGIWEMDERYSFNPEEVRIVEVDIKL